MQPTYPAEADAFRTKITEFLDTNLPADWSGIGALADAERAEFQNEWRQTLRANNLVIVDELMRSSTRLYANPRALDNPSKRSRIDDLVLLLSSVLEARKRVMLEVNVGAERVDALVELLPCMRAPTIASLHGGDSFAIKVAVPRDQVAMLIPEIRAAGGTDIVVTQPTQIIA